MLESNYLTMLLKPTYEKPVDTAQDILDRGLRIVRSSISAGIIEDLKNSPFAITRELAKRTDVARVMIYVLTFLF